MRSRGRNFSNVTLAPESARCHRERLKITYGSCVERLVQDLAPDPASFRAHFGLVRDYVAGTPGSHAALMAAARDSPEAMTNSVVALGAVLLDLAAEAHHLSPTAMLDRLADIVSQVVEGTS